MTVEAVVWVVLVVTIWKDIAEDKIGKRRKKQVRMNNGDEVK